MFHDEEKTLFVLLSCLAIYRHSTILLSVICWKKSVVENLIKQEVPITTPWKDDENCYEFKINIEAFDKLFAYHTYTKSKHYKLAWLKDKEKKLGHKIIQHYNLLKK
jgi:hypothetical protein